jgi:hypothetical protein
MRTRVVLAAPAFLCALALAACGGGGGGSAAGGGGGGGGVIPTPSPVPTAPGYVSPQAGVTRLSPTSSGVFASAILAASANGTLVVQSAETPAEPTGNTPTMTEYDVTASETAGIAGSSVLRTTQATTRTLQEQISYRPRLDPRTSATAQFRHARSPFGSISRGLAPQSIRRASAHALNDQRTFAIRTGAITGVTSACGSGQLSAGGSCYANVSTHLLAISQHAYVWVDDALNGQFGFTQADWTAVGTTFDTDFTREVAAFAPAFLTTNPTPTYTQCDATGATLPQTSWQPVPDLSGNDPHISIVITAALDSTGEGGYFDFNNLLNDQELNCAYKGPHVPSNGMPMFVLAGDTYTLGSGTIHDEGYWRQYDIQRGLPHEFQHYLHALNKVIAADIASPSSGEFDDSFIDEGTSMLAEDLVNSGNAQSGDTLVNQAVYLLAPGNYSLTAFTGYTSDPLSTATNPPYGFYRNTAGSYGEAYLFMRYLYDRFGGDVALHRLYADLSQPVSGTANTHPDVAAAGNGETFTQLYADFVSAVAARGVATGGDARYQFSSSITLVGKKTIPLPGGQTWDVVLDGPRSPENFSASTPGSSPRIKLTPTGSTVTAKLIQGSTLFFNVAPAVSPGATVLGSVPNAAGRLNAALVQGAYDDTGACIGPAPGC